jgi:Sigma-70 region 2
MPSEPSPDVLRQLRQVIRPEEISGISDAQLLRRWVAQRDEAAFEILLWRHGPMVLDVCRRILRDSHRAEDAFQATFLTLTRKAGSIGNAEALDAIRSGSSRASARIEWPWRKASRMAGRQWCRGWGVDCVLSGHFTGADCKLAPPLACSSRYLRKRAPRNKMTTTNETA